MSEWPDVQLSFDVGGGRYLQRVRRALIIGIDYSSHPGSFFRNKTSVKDAYTMANFLRSNLSFDDVRIMTDDSPSDLPTKENILGAMSALVDDAQTNDSFFFYFSGHAIQIDGVHQCICAIDYLGDDPNPHYHVTPGLIVDHIMYRHLVDPLPFRCRLTAVFDCPHSGTILDLPYLYRSNGVFKPLRLRPPYGPGVPSHADVVSLSACKDNQGALETSQGGGALTCAFIDCMSEFENTLTLEQLIMNVRDYMKSHGSPQRPQLSTGHEIGADVPFIV